MPLAWILAKLTGKKLVFDMFYSMYDTYVFDRQSTKPDSFRAKTYYWIDKLSTILADKIITDTKSSAIYYKKLFKINPQKLQHIYLGAEKIFKRKRHQKRQKLIIEFHGMFTRLTGAEYFIEAAKKLEHSKNLEFWLIGGSVVYKEPFQYINRLKPENLIYFPQMSVKDLGAHISQADISIGHLGTTKKARVVITNKTFHSLASGTMQIAIDSPANRELLIHYKNALLVKAGHTNDLVDKIKLIAKNKNLREHIANEGYLLYKNKLTNEAIGKTLKKELERLIHN
jgi:glycosyltransferase involved in cell wall biosynthesis